MRRHFSQGRDRRNYEEYCLVIWQCLNGENNEVIVVLFVNDNNTQERKRIGWREINSNDEAP